MENSPKKDGKTKPRLALALRMRCPYCGETPLRAEGSWFHFRQGCPHCDYRYERELGYYTAASWMVAFPVVSLFAFVVAALMLWLVPGIGGLGVVAVASVLTLLLGIVVTPYCMAFWLYLEHWFHPLNHEDGIDNELVN